MISSLQRPLPENTQHSQQTNIHAPGGIRTQDRNMRAAADLRFRPRGYWHRLKCCTARQNVHYLANNYKNLQIRSWWSYGLRQRSSAPWLQESRVRILLMTAMFALLFLMCCVGSGLFNELITPLQKPYRMSVSDWVRSRHLKKAAAKFYLR
jgi:hypothetical protein